MKPIFFAYERVHGEFAAQKLGFHKDQVTIFTNPEAVNGMRELEVYVVNPIRYHASIRQIRERCGLLEKLTAYRCKIEMLELR